MWKQRFLSLAVILGLSVFTLHFFCTAAYLAPDSWVPNYVRKGVRGYIVPLFHQRLKVFAPDPPTDGPRLSFQFTTTEGAQSAWICPGDSLLQKHYQYRISHYQKAYRLYEGMANNLVSMHFRLNYQQSPGNDTTANYRQAVSQHVCYQMANRYALDYLERHYPSKEIRSLRLKTSRWKRGEAAHQELEYPALEL
ncbi:MAG: hypothetical protein ACFB10_19955 [Salibacteraceae bacterium]